MKHHEHDGQSIDVNLSQVRRIVELGVNRASLFMGFALNAASRDDVADCSLTDHASIAPKTGKPEDMDCFRREFKQWVVLCGLREIVEAFNLFLDRVAEVCCLIAVSKGELKHDEMEKKINQVRNKGLPGKHRELEQCFDVSTQYIGDLISISKARDCLAHNMGIVTKQHVDDSGKMVLTWHGAIDCVLRDVHGNCHVLGFDTQQAITLESPSLYLESVQRQKEYASGQVLDLSAQDVAELCTCARLASMQIVKKVYAYATKIGIKVTINNSGDGPTPC